MAVVARHVDDFGVAGVSEVVVELVVAATPQGSPETAAQDEQRRHPREDRQRLADAHGDHKLQVQ